MTGFNQSLLRLFIAGIVIFLPASAFAVIGGIMNAEEAGQADTAALTTEAGVFKSIGMGIVLSIAQCEGYEGCTPAVNAGEIDQLIKALDDRINGLVVRQQENEEDLNEVLTAYVNERENYLRYKDELGAITGEIGAEEEITEEEALTGEEEVIEGPAEEVTATPEEFSVFEDVDESLEEESGDELGDEEPLEDTVDQ